MSKRSRQRRAARDQKHRRTRRQVMALAASLLVFGAIVIVWQVASRDGKATIPTTTAQVNRIGVHDASAMVGKGDAILVDVRSRSFYDAKHAEGAMALPESEIDQLFGTIPEYQKLILYCT